MNNNQKKNLAALVSAAFLFLALLDGWPYDFFTILRWVVCLSSFYIAWLLTQEDRDGWSLIFDALGILFNPIIIIPLSRATWTPIDLIVGIFMVVSMFFIKLEKKNETH